jgi:O-antigen/teichoic acid export membrane protein
MPMTGERDAQRDAITDRASERTAMAAVWLVGGRLLARSIDIVSLLILARLLGPAEFGTIAVAMVLIYIVEALLEMPTAGALVRLPAITQSQLDTAFTLGLLRGVAIASALVLLSYPYAAFNNDPHLAPLICALGFAPAIRGMISPSMVRYVRAIDFRREFLLDVLGKLATLVVSVTVALLTRNYWAIAAGTIAAPCVMAVISYVLAPYRPRLTLRDWPVFASMIQWNFVGQLLAAINWQIDRFLLGRLVPRDVLGRFSVSGDLASIPHQALIVPILRPLLSGLSALPEDPVRLGQAYHKATAGIVLVGAPVLIGMAAMSEPIVRLALGPNWEAAAPLLALLALSNVLTLTSAPLGALAFRLGKFHVGAMQILLEFVLRTPLMIVAAYHYGVAGVLVARFICAVYMMGVTAVLARHLIGLPIRAQLLAPWRSWVAACAMGLLVHHAVPYLDRMPGEVMYALGAAALAGTGAVVYAAAVLLLWLLAGRPGGAERIVLDRLTSGFALVRRRFA